MGSQVVNLLVIIAVGVIIANLVASANVNGVTTLFCNLSNLWSIGVSGMLGQQATTKKC